MGLFSLLTDVQSDDHEEEQFAPNIKNKIKIENCKPFILSTDIVFFEN